MILPEEIVAERVAPTLRYLVTRELAGRGLREAEIARLLGVSQAAVSKYRLGRVRVDPRVAQDPRVRNLAARLAEGFAGGTMSPFQALGETIRLVRALENRDLACVLHGEAAPFLRGLACDLCVRSGESTLLEDASVLSDLRDAVRRLEAEPGFVSLIPNVGTNIARARANPSGLADVAAIPGRLSELKGRLRVPAPPEFGASRHVGEVVLAAAARSDRRAALNVACRDDVLAACRQLRWRVLEFDAAYEGRARRLRAKLARREVPDVLYHRGAFGIEPIAYLLGRTAAEVADRAVALTRLLAAQRTSPSTGGARQRGGAVSPRGS